ncbi:MAG: ribonuclease III [Rickettsiales bacterium]|jgi:ribonuclease-3|nr:ribonuclease III [Rickettsiales bacterium]
MQINYTFKNKKLLDHALTHSSSVKNKLQSNERLEFLGDRVLSLSLSHFLFEKYPSDDEGFLAKRHAILANADTLYKLAKKIELDTDIKTSFKINSENGQDKNIFPDAMEALIGAIYLDSDFDTARQFVVDLYGDLLTTVQEPPQDFKTKLQELTQKKYKETPLYELIDMTGPDHHPSFKVKATIKKFSTTGTGETKKIAEQSAAEKLLQKIS